MKERTKAEHEKLSWAEMANILNDKGPFIKSAKTWKNVNMDIYNKC